MNKINNFCNHLFSNDITNEKKKKKACSNFTNNEFIVLEYNFKENETKKGKDTHQITKLERSVCLGTT
ncbi:hypothetical protein C923_05069 [Plasmodium falciparum UGT5.1]|uniref:Uncharacterized protein n=2 Tax=Plasmodium falciparum TaxID=5833 RepID=A0A024W2I8_PLAFA|nr:hypothetical protein PFTANZ_04916 [Plasmodium falciparum Tanzania (2000708)]EWC74264.1 hypothetical protein C923_05069 [Plasmodium falciparum UGT5.1]